MSYSFYNNYYSPIMAEGNVVNPGVIKRVEKGREVAPSVHEAQVTVDRGGEEFTYTSELISEDASPEQQRNFFVAGQKKEAARYEGNVQKTEQWLAEISQAKREIMTEENRDTIERQINEAEAALAEMQQALEEVLSVYESNQKKLLAMSDEEISNREIDNPVSKLMDESYPVMRVSKDAMKKAWLKIEAALK